jgi:hypothetical protein
MKHSSRILAHASVALALLSLFACSVAPQVTVKTDYDHAVSFGKYRTYTIDASSTGLSPSAQAMLLSTLRTGLAGRGLTETSPGNASLYIVPKVYTKQMVNVIPSQGVTLYRSSDGLYRPGNVALNADVKEYTEGSLVIDFVDSKTHSLVFRGLAQAAVSSVSERNVAAVQDAVNKIVAAYP